MDDLMTISMQEAVKTRSLRESDVPKLRHGDQLVLDIITGSRILSRNASELIRYLRTFGLNHGCTYTFETKKLAWHPGENYADGWYIHVQEERSPVQVPFEYFAVTPDLEARLQRRSEHQIQ